MQQSNEQTGSKSELKATKATLETLQNIEQICCRICLEDMSPQETFVVCHCKGANAHVHQKCLLQWAKKTQKYRQAFDIYYYHCEICKHKILLEVVTKLRCLKWRQISFCGQDFCCTFSSLTILMLGLSMFIAGLYLKLTSKDSDIEYLFDLTLSLAVIIISFDLILAVLYFVLFNEVVVVGIMLSEEQRRLIKEKQLKVSNSHDEGEKDSKKSKGKKETNQNINQTQAFFIEENHGQEVREILEDARYQTLNRHQQTNERPARQIFLFPQNQQVENLPANLQENHRQYPMQTQIIQPNLQSTSLANNLHDQNKPQNQEIHNFSLKDESLIRNQLQNSNQRDFSASAVQQFQTRSIMVRSISIKTRNDYQNNLSSYHSTPNNNDSSTFSNIENDISHNQIPTPKSLIVKKPSPLMRFRKTLDQSLVRSQIHLRQQKLKFYGEGQHERVSEEGQQMENDMDFYFVQASNKKLEPGIKNSSSKALKRYNDTDLQKRRQDNN